MVTVTIIKTALSDFVNMVSVELDIPQASLITTHDISSVEHTSYFTEVMQMLDASKCYFCCEQITAEVTRPRAIYDSSTQTGYIFIPC